MRILFDQGVPVPLRQVFAGHDVATAYELGWSRLRNGELLTQSENQFDLLITTDQNLPYQQSLSGRQLAIFILPTTDWRKLEPHADQIAQEALSTPPGTYREYELPE